MVKSKSKRNLAVVNLAFFLGCSLSCGTLVGAYKTGIIGQCFADLANKRELCFKCGTLTLQEQTNGKVSPKRLLHLNLCGGVFRCLNNCYITEVEENKMN